MDDIKGILKDRTTWQSDFDGAGDKCEFNRLGSAWPLDYQWTDFWLSTLFPHVHALINTDWNGEGEVVNDIGDQKHKLGNAKLL